MKHLKTKAMVLGIFSFMLSSMSCNSNQDVGESRVKITYTTPTRLVYDGREFLVAEDRLDSRPVQSSGQLNNKGKHLWYDGENNSRSVMLFGKQQKNESLQDYCNRTVEEGLGLVVSKDMLREMNDAVSFTKNNSVERLFFVNHDGSIEKKVDGEPLKDGRFIVELDKKISQSSMYDVHTHPYVENFQEKDIVGLSVPSPADMSESSEQVNVLIYFKRIEIPDFQTVGGVPKREWEANFKLYNKYGEIPGSDDTFNAMKGRINSVLKTQRKMDKERE